jgi:hypothetical protein
VQKIIDDVLSWPASLGYFLIGLGMASVGGWATTKFEAIQNAELAAQRQREMAEQERERREGVQEAATRSKADFNFAKQIEEVLGTKRRDHHF